MNQTNNTIQFSQFAAVSKDSDEVLGKILYYTLSSILIDREVLARLCDTVDFPYKPIRRSSLADAFRSATGDIYHRLVVKDAGVPQIINVYCRDKYADRLPLDANSMFVVDDEKQRSKMALAFYRTIQKDLAEYEKRATHLIQSGNQSPAIMDRMVLSIRELERKKIYYESILKQELHEVDEQYTSLRYLSDELQIRARSIQAQKRLAA